MYVVPQTDYKLKILNHTKTSGWDQCVIQETGSTEVRTAETSEEEPDDQESDHSNLTRLTMPKRVKMKGLIIILAA